MQRHGDERKQREPHVHAPHFDDGEDAQKRRVAHHHDARAEAFLDGLEIVGKPGHEIPHFVDLIVLGGKVLTVVEHPVADGSLHADARAEKADAPGKAPHHHHKDDDNERHTDLIEQEVQIEGNGAFRRLDDPRIDAVDDHAVKLGNFELKVVDEHERRKPHQEDPGIFQIVFVDVFPEDHASFSPGRK